eukprot:NODE_162_length_16547_cov_0.334326.p12 type:complete len:105 gc:universal NODE_162_length_16547_cov_0.334326:3458-3772(+)
MPFSGYSCSCESAVKVDLRSAVFSTTELFACVPLISSGNFEVLMYGFKILIEIVTLENWTEKSGKKRIYFKHMDEESPTSQHTQLKGYHLQVLILTLLVENPYT